MAHPDDPPPACHTPEDRVGGRRGLDLVAHAAARFRTRCGTVRAEGAIADVGAHERGADGRHAEPVTRVLDAERVEEALDRADNGGAATVDWSAVRDAFCPGQTHYDNFYDDAAFWPSHVDGLRLPDGAYALEAARLECDGTLTRVNVPVSVQRCRQARR